MVVGTQARRFQQLDKLQLWLSALISRPQDLVIVQQRLASGQKWHMELPAIESIAKFAQIHLQMFRTGTMVGTIDKCFCVANDAV